jgi:hypothetical protein
MSRSPNLAILLGTLVLLACAPGVASALPSAQQPARQPGEQILVDLANKSRAEAGLKPLVWDESLAAAARAHAQLMAAQGLISHRYQGEADLGQRAAQAGAHFSLIEENIAMGFTPDTIHDSWMHSQGHHDNLLNPKIDRIGVALVQVRGNLYAVADYSQAVEALTQAQVEAKVGAMLRSRGLTLAAGQTDQTAARQYCAQDSGGAGRGQGASFLMRWQSADISRLPTDLESRIASGTYHQAAVGACAPKGDSDSGPVFSGYRVAVLLY